MKNVIPRNAKTIVGVFLSGNAEGKRMTITREFDGWRGRDEDGKTWRVFVSHMRIPELFKIESIEI